MSDETNVRRETKATLARKAKDARKDQLVQAELCRYDAAGVFRGRAEAYEDALALLDAEET